MIYIMILLVVISILPLLISSTLLARLMQNGWQLWLKTEIFDVDEIYTAD